MTNQNNAYLDFIDKCNLSFNLGNAVKHISRCGIDKTPEDALDNLKKAAAFIKREINARSQNVTSTPELQNPKTEAKAPLKKKNKASEMRQLKRDMEQERAEWQAEIANRMALKKKKRQHRI